VQAYLDTLLEGPKYTAGEPLLELILPKLDPEIVILSPPATRGRITVETPFTVNEVIFGDAYEIAL
jgi:hypothetical protein